MKITLPEYREAIYIILKNKKCSISLLQKEMEISQTRAVKIMEKLEKDGYISAKDGSKARKVLIEEYEGARMRKNRKKAETTPDGRKREGKGGQPNYWHELEMSSKLDAVKGWISEGYTVVQMCEHLGISDTTWYKWQAERQEFKDAIRAGRFQSNGELINAANNQAKGFYVPQSEFIKVKDYRKVYDESKGCHIWIPFERIEEREKMVFIQPNAQVLQFMLRNREPDKYKQQDKEHTNTGNEFDHMTDEELEAYEKGLRDE